MATFQAQVEGLTGLSIDGSSTPTQNELSQFLKDGVIDVTKKCIDMNPAEVHNFLTVSSDQTANGSLDLNGARIVSVVREAGTSDDWRNCKQIHPSLQSRVTDTDSLHFASKFNPVFTVLDNGKISVFPAPDSDPDQFKVYYVNNVPKDKSGAALVYSHSDIQNFVDDKVYLVVIYAAIKCLEAKMAKYAITEEDEELVTAISSNIIALHNQYLGAFTPGQQQQQLARQRQAQGAADES